jgi:hypothetical protein
MFTLDEKALGNLVEGIVRRVLGEMVSGDRRREVRPKNGKRAKSHPNAKRTCPANGCKSPFAPRFGGWCPKHHNTAGFKKWAKARKAKG